jgi:hypothetical protein
VRTRVDLRLVGEARAFQLRFRCDDCAHFDDRAAACEHGFPTSPHRAAALEVGGEIVFCKDFELGGVP